ncbi:MAG: DmsC/YnfH family molybdoenzyme membrane anchor subunit [Opitutales bacterium]
MNATLPEIEETPIDRLLRTQQQLDTPVSRFSKEYNRLSSGDPGTARSRFQNLIPLTAPGAGEQYAFEVDLDQCTGCKACVSACHSLNGLADNETWRDVGLLKGGSSESPFLQTVTSACHHCVEPACLEGCPVNAYEKDPATGIVLHLDDQCIGCQYCVLKCPYDVPKYSESFGIVRKCDMCHGRLAEGEAPACVQACPNEAIKITTVNITGTTDTARSFGGETRGKSLLPGTVDSAYTVPTTRYRSNKGLPTNAGPVDAASTRPQHPHWPLIFMLVWTQASVGALGAGLASPGVSGPILGGIAALCCSLGLAASTLHLGKPFKAWRAFLGLPHSWLSREIVVFGGYFPLLATAALLPFAPSFVPPLPMAGMIAPIAFVFGLAGVFCSAMIYHDTRRPFWSLPRSAAKFFGSTWVLGSAAALAVFAATGESVLIPALSVALASALKLGIEARLLSPAVAGGLSPVAGSATLIQRHLGRSMHLRLAAGVFGGLLFPLLCLASGPGLFTAVFAALGFLMCLTGELAERTLYFRAVVPFKMPGGIAT